MDADPSRYIKSHILKARVGLKNVENRVSICSAKYCSTDNPISSNLQNTFGSLSLNNSFSKRRSPLIPLISQQRRAEFVNLLIFRPFLPSLAANISMVNAYSFVS